MWVRLNSQFRHKIVAQSFDVRFAKCGPTDSTSLHPLHRGG